MHGPTASCDPPPASPRLAGSSGTIVLRCKDLKVLQLEIPGMEECLNIASSIEVSSWVAREPGPSRAGVRRVGRKTWLPAVFALGLSLTWVNTQLPAGACRTSGASICLPSPRLQLGHGQEPGTGVAFAEPWGDGRNFPSHLRALVRAPQP